MDAISALASMSPESLRILMGPENTHAIASTVIAIIGAMVFFMVLCFFIGLFEKATESRKTENYRKVVSDMYVAGYIRKLAEEDKINLDDEYKRYKLYEKKQRNKNKDLDGTIEANLKDKVTEKVDKEVEAMNKQAK